MDPDLVDLMSRVQTGHTTCIRAAEIIEEREAALTPDRKTMVNRFLSWKLPQSVKPDLCVMDQDYPHRTGTCVFSAAEVRQMVDHMLGDF